MGGCEEQRRALGNPVVITEKTFALRYSGFWKGLLPMLERHTRRCNEAGVKVFRPLKTTQAASARGGINELGFQLFLESQKTGIEPSKLPEASVSRCMTFASNQISELRQASRQPLAAVNATASTESLELAERLLRFLKARSPALCLLRPSFPGCGWVESCAGDLVCDGTLVEVKAGARGFRSADFRQALIYCALAFASKSIEIERVCLLNLRTGLGIEDSLEALCQEAAGVGSVDVLSEIISFCTETDDRQVGWGIE